MILSAISKRGHVRVRAKQAFYRLAGNSLGQLGVVEGKFSARA
jgi:hypothetical protein